MRSFASIATFATLAFASVASALPVVNMARTPGAIDVTTEVGNDVHNIAPIVKPRVVVAATVADTSADIQARHGQLSVVEIISEVTTKITPLCKNITDTVSAQNVNVDTVVPVVLNVLGQVVNTIDQAKSDILYSISIGVNPLLLDGQVLDLKAVAELVGALIITVVDCLGIVFKVLGGVHAEVLTIIAHIGVILGGIITLILPIAGGLLAVLMPIIKPVVPTILSLGLNTVTSVLSIAL